MLYLHHTVDLLGFARQSERLQEDAQRLVDGEAAKVKQLDKRSCRHM